MIDTTSDSNSKSVISASFLIVAESSGEQRLPTSDNQNQEAKPPTFSKGSADVSIQESLRIGSDAIFHSPAGRRDSGFGSGRQWDFGIWHQFPEAGNGLRIREKPLLQPAGNASSDLRMDTA